MTPRRPLANRRASITFSFEVGGLAYVATASRYPDGAVGEIFLSNHKSNSTADVNARDSAIACSPTVRRRRRNHPQSTVPRQPRSRQWLARRGARRHCKGQPIPMSTEYLTPARHMDATTAERGGRASASTRSSPRSGCATLDLLAATEKLRRKCSDGRECPAHPFLGATQS
jgi:hypothetical protein